MRTSSDFCDTVDGGVPVEELDDDPVGIADLEGALAPLLLGQWHGDGHTLVLQPGEFPFDVVDDEGEDDAACAPPARSPPRTPLDSPGGKRLITIAEENRALFDAHPWAATVSTLRPPLGPGLIGKYEHELSALDGLGLDDVEMDDCLSHLLTFVQASAQAGIAMDAPLLARVLDERAYPLATRVGTAAGAAHRNAHDPAHAYRFRLHRVLDGLASLIDNRQVPPVS